MCTIVMVPQGLLVADDVFVPGAVVVSLSGLPVVTVDPILVAVFVAAAATEFAKLLDK